MSAHEFKAGDRVVTSGGAEAFLVAIDGGVGWIKSRSGYYWHQSLSEIRPVPATETVTFTVEKDVLDAACGESAHGDYGSRDAANKVFDAIRAARPSPQTGPPVAVRKFAVGDRVIVTSQPAGRADNGVIGRLFAITGTSSNGYGWLIANKEHSLVVASSDIRHATEAEIADMETSSHPLLDN